MALTLLSAVLLSGCETIGNAKKDQTMNLRLKEYAHEVRWGQLEALPSYLKPDMVDEQKDVAVDPQNIRVTNYEVLRRVHPGEENQVSQTVRIEYLFRDRQVVKTLIDLQLWEYIPDSKDWQRANPIPVFK